MPGSTFKVVTTGSPWRPGSITLDSQFERVTKWTPPQTSNPIQNYDGINCGGDLPRGVPAQLQHPVRPDRARRRRRRHGQRAPSVGRRRAGTDRPPPAGGEHVRRHRRPRPATAAAGDARLRPAGGPDGPVAHGDGRPAVANDGVMMSRSSSRRRWTARTHADPHRPEVWLRPISAETAATLNSLMQGVVTDGTASCCLGTRGIPVAAKTGTAQLNDRRRARGSNAWIIAFAPADSPQYAVAVMLEDSPRCRPRRAAASPDRSPSACSKRRSADDSDARRIRRRPDRRRPASVSSTCVLRRRMLLGTPRPEPQTGRHQ